MRGETELSGFSGKLSGRYCVTPSRCGSGEEERQAKKLRRAEDLHRPILRQETRPTPRQRGNAGGDAAGQVVQAGVGSRCSSFRCGWSHPGLAPGPRFRPLVRRAGVEPAGGEDRPPRIPSAASSNGTRSAPLPPGLAKALQPLLPFSSPVRTRLRWASARWGGAGALRYRSALA